MIPTDTTPKPATPTRRLLTLGAGLASAASLAGCAPAKPRDPNAPRLRPAPAPFELDEDAAPPAPRRP